MKPPRPNSDNVSLIRPLVVLVGVFLILFNVNGVRVSALTSVLSTQTTTKSISPLKINELKLDTIDDKLDEKAAKLEKKNKEIQIIKGNLAKVASKKTTIETEVNDLKSQVAALQQQLAEKKRIEALRVVQISGYASDASGNMYDAGNCTWYVKSKRPDIGNMWGNAKHWISGAVGAGFKTGSQAKKGAVGVSTDGWAGHVVYVEEWYPNGTALISEMNYGGLYSMNTRVVAESDFTYIYEKP